MEVHSITGIHVEVLVGGAWLMMQHWVLLLLVLWVVLGLLLVSWVSLFQLPKATPDVYFQPPTGVVMVVLWVVERMLCQTCLGG